MKLKRNMRVRVKQDCKSLNVGFPVKAGQLGRVMNDTREADCALVELDGYESEREKANAFLQKHGEFPNEVAWLVALPLTNLEEVV